MEDSSSMKSLADMSFEDAYRQIERIVNVLETGRGELEESLTNYEHAIKLVRLCRQKLDAATQRIELLKGLDAEGRPILEAQSDSDLQSKSDVVGRQSTPVSNASTSSRSRTTRSSGVSRNSTSQSEENAPPF